MEHHPLWERDHAVLYRKQVKYHLTLKIASATVTNLDKGNSGIWYGYIYGAREYKQQFDNIDSAKQWCVLNLRALLQVSLDTLDGKVKQK